MGHRRLAGFLSEQAIGGASFLRIDVPKADTPSSPIHGATPTNVDGQWAATQFYTGASVYCITPVTETLARKVAETCQPAPVTEWDLKRALPSSSFDSGDDEDDGDP